MASGPRTGALASFRSERTPDGVREKRDVLDAIAQGRDLKPHDCEAKQQILTKRPKADGVSERTIRRGHHAYIHGAWSVLSDAPHFPLLQHTKKLGLGPRRQLAHFIQEQAATVRVFHETRARANGAGERAARMSEQLSLDQFVGERRAVDGDEPAVPPRAQPMNRARNELLAGAALTFHENGKRRDGRPRHRFAERDD